MARYTIIFLFAFHWANAQTNSFFQSGGSSYLFSCKTNLLPEQKITLRVQPLKHEAFFCKMEDKLHNRFNVWLTLRAGSDESYRKLISKPED
ncbi:MAG: hypothetical protein ACXVOH_08505 [Bacteroidia bacterium]